MEQTAESARVSPLTARPRPMALVWLRELRAPFFVGTVMPAVFGAAYAHYAGVSFSWPLFGLTVLGTMLTNAGLNMTNDYFDHRSGDDYLTPSTPVSGGSKVIQEGLLRPTQVLGAAIGCLAAASLIGLYLNFITGGKVILAVGIVGMIIAWFYTAPPLRFGSRSGLGEIVCVLGCGPIIALGAFFVQARAFSWRVVAASLPIGLLMGLVLFINEFHDAKADGSVGKRTLVVAIGTRASAVVLRITLMLTYVLLAALVWLRLLPAVALLTLATLPLAVFIAVRAARFHADSPRLLPANLAMIMLHIVIGAALTAMVALR
jgi:1,4-dihydroxy-2-naphthoate polyprenyltransferase